ncbi:hypothetical protein N7451_006407 [Penicillium sp. IBT 35674x]|nr:hypothetical protein N7451_006407 [Penicillium sp. IBT 35674x]
MTKNRFDLREAVFESSAYLAEVLARCAYVETNFHRKSVGENDMIRNATIGTYKAILQYAAEILASQNLGSRRWILDSITTATNEHLTELQKSVEKQEQKLFIEIQLNEHLQHAQEAKKILAGLDDISTSLHGLIHNFSLPIVKGAFLDAYENQHEAMCLPNTRVEILEQISQRAESSESKFMFWLCGMAGTGKSTIARTMAQYFEDNGHLGARFFFKKGEIDRGNARRFISTLAKQLIVQVPQLAPIVLKAIEVDPKISERSLVTQFENLLTKPLQETRLDSSTTLVIVIDALDECETKEIRTILKILPQVRGSISIKLKVFMTSRPELPIRLGIKKSHDHQVFVLNEVPNPVIERDIRLFLNDSLSKIREDSDLLPPNWPTAEEIEKLTLLCVPLFIFAATLCRFIGDGIKSPEDRLEAVLQIRGTASSDQMEDIYKPVLEQALYSSNQRESRDLQEEFCEIVGSIIILATPLSVTTLGRLLDLPERKITFLLNRLHSVLSVTEDSNTPVRILHLSFRDFLVATKEDFHVDEALSNRKIATHCLRIMSSNLQHDICALGHYGILLEDIERQLIDQHLPEDLQYSCRFWILHLEQSEAPISEMEVFEFLKKHFLHWLEVMSLLDIIPEAVSSIDKLWSSQQSNPTSELASFLYDAKRFLFKNFQILVTAPLQVYYSGLIFSPMESIIRKCFEAELHKDIPTLSQVERTWSAELQTLETYTGVVKSMAFSPDGQTLASGSSGGIIQLWDTQTGNELWTLEGHLDDVVSVAFSPDSQTLASCSSYDGAIKLWDTQTGNQLRALEGQSDRVCSVAFSQDSHTLALGLLDRTIKLWDTQTDTEISVLEGHTRVVQSMSFSSDSDILASGSDDKLIKLWNTQTGNELRALEGSLDQVYSLAFSSDNQTLASGSDNHIIRLWDIQRNELRTLESSAKVTCIVFSPDSQTLASGSIGTIKLWDTQTGNELWTLKGHSDWVKSVAFSPDIQTLASGSYDGTIKLWDTRISNSPQIKENYSASIDVIAFSPDNQTLVSGSTDGIVQVWGTQTGNKLRTLEGHSDAVISVALSLDGQILASGSHCDIKVWNPQTGSELWTLKGHSDWVKSVAFSPDSQTLASGSCDGTIRLWYLRTGRELRTLNGHSEGTTLVVIFSLDSQTLASVSDNGTVKLWGARMGNEIWTREEYQYEASFMAFSQDSRTLTVGSAYGPIALLDAETGNELLIIKINSYSPLKSLDFSPDSRILVSGSSGGLMLWDIRTGNELQIINDHSYSTGSAADQISYKVDGQVSLANFNEWIALGDKNLIWLPAEYRHCTCSAIKGNTLALAYGDGKIFIVGLSTD